MKVFLSSTAQDLVAHRKVADDTILRLSQEAVAMERFGPLPGEPVEECERKARESDIVVCIVAHRYGFVPEKGKGSITQREVKAAKGAGKDVLVFIVADDHPWSQKKEQDLLTDPTVSVDPARVAEVLENVAGLTAYKTWLLKTFVCDTFTTPDELGRKIAIALSNYSAKKTSPAASPAPKQGEIRIVHALQPAPHFYGRDALVTELTTWVADLASPDRVWALVNTGLLHAVSCGYGLLRIELLVVMSRIHLAWPDAPKAIQAAREALDLAIHPECQYAWGEADAAQAWGEAYFANHEPTLAKRAFARALAVRKRIEHPGVAETEKWLARVG
jgi:hypothetical protein